MKGVLWWFRQLGKQQAKRGEHDVLNDHERELLEVQQRQLDIAFRLNRLEQPMSEAV